MSKDSGAVDDATADRRLFGEQVRTQTAYIACDLGVVRVSLAGGRVGQAGVTERCTATSVAADGERVVAGTVGGVLVDEGDGFERLGDPFEVAAVGLASGRILAGGDDGRVLAWTPDHGWETLGEVDGPERFDGAFLGADSGVYRVTETLEPLGLSAATDVAGDGSFAATENGIYRRKADGWEQEHERPATTVVTAGGDVHAAGEQGVLERTGEAWTSVDTPAEPVDLSSAGMLCGITRDGTLIITESGADGDRRWRSHPLGLRGVAEFDTE
jgi:hypothetical protein